MTRDGETATELGHPGEAPLRVRSFRVNVIDGPTAGNVWEGGPRCTIGSAASNDLVIDDSTVSRFHCEVSVRPGGLRVRDLESKNGTSLDGVSVFDAEIRHGSVLRCGRTALRFELGERLVDLALSTRTSFGELAGTSPAMRALFAVLERAALGDTTVLLEGETGTGKEGAARALHAAGSRRAGPLRVVDCSAISASLFESELFGHERGAFTGASEQHAGVFEAARGGTVLLDEVGELPLDLQPKLLRVLEAREVRRLGATSVIPIDVRVIAATNRDLRAEVNAGAFRADLYYRLAVVRAELPPLRQRPEDLPLLVDAIVADLERTGKASSDVAAELRAPRFAAELAGEAWPGNVRELRNLIERCAVLGVAAARATPGPRAAAVDVDLQLPFKEARQRVLDEFELRYLVGLLDAHGDNISAAARAAGISRVSLYAMLRRHNVRD